MSNVITNEILLEALNYITQQNNEIKRDVNAIKEVISRQEEYLSELNNKVLNLVKENRILKHKLALVDKKQQHNNIIIFGVKEDETKDLINTAVELFQNSLLVDITTADIGNIFRLGKPTVDKNRPILVQLTAFLKKQQIYTNIKHLRGTGIYIGKDLNEGEREDHKILRNNLKYARNNKHTAFIKNNKLFIDGNAYTASQKREKDLSQSSLITDVLSKTKSVPSSCKNYLHDPGSNEEVEEGEKGEVKEVEEDKESETDLQFDIDSSVNKTSRDKKRIASKSRQEKKGKFR